MYQVYVPIEYAEELFTLGLGGYLPTNEQLVFANRVSEVNVVFFWLTIYCVKASFLDLDWTIFGVSRKFRMVWMVVAGYTVLSFLATFLAIFWSCGTPKQFDNYVACNSISQQLALGLETVWCVLNVVGDIMIMFLPLGMLRAMHITNAQKLGLAAVAGLVIIVIVFDILRTVFTIGDEATSFPNANAVWDILEPTIAVIVCALPPYRTLITKKKRPFKSYEELVGGGSTKKSDPRSAKTLESHNHEMENMSAYNNSSTRSVLGHSQEAPAS